jgi:hypothetical protein
VLSADLGRLERGLAVAATAALLTIALIVAVTGAPVAWLALGLTGVLSTVVFARAIWQRRFFEPLTIVAGFTLVSFAVRPLQLFLSVDDLLSWYPATTLDQATLTLDRSETAQFVTRKLEGPLEPALTRTMVAVTLFFCLFAVGYLLPVGRRLRGRMSRVGAAVVDLNIRAVVVACLAVGFVSQMIVLALAGGPAEAFEGQLDSTVIDAGSPVVMHFLMGFSTVGIVCWAAWSRPSSRAERLAFVAATVEVVVFWALAGSRTRVLLLFFMLAVVVHYAWRPLTRRAVVGGLVGCVLLGAALLSVRESTLDEPFGEALLSAPDYIVNPSGILNDFTEFDILFTATSVIPSERDYGYGQGALDALKSYVPGPLLADKPESTDQEFREFVWGGSQSGGRPYTLVGDFYNDFGFPGIAVGAVLFGMLGRLLLALVRAPAGRPGHAYRVALYAIGAAVFYMALATAYTLPIGFLIEFALPFLVAVHVLGPLGDRLGAGVRSQGRARQRTAA